MEVVPLWANAVFQGGGVKAIGLVGALTVAEQRGYRWRRMAGTSAGAIIASLVAAGYTAEEIRRVIEELDYTLCTEPGAWHLLPYIGPVARLWIKKGLYSGKEIERWLDDLLRQKGVHTFADLKAGTLQIVVSDITRGRLVVLPEDLKLYGLSAVDLPVARSVRMSCGIPFFFDPIVLYSRSEPKRNYMVDGGVLSNFPLWLFDEEAPKWPTFGFRLVSEDGEAAPHEIRGPFSLFRALFQTMMDAHDTRHLEEQDKVRTILVPSLGVKSTDFHITPEKSAALFDAGKKAAEKFFRQWDFQQYLKNFHGKVVVTINRRQNKLP
jgi:NTE family protein